MNVSWFSAGISSFVATWLVRDELDEIIYQHIDDQHPDTMRFLHDCEDLLGRKILVQRNPEYPSVESVIRKFRFISSPYGAKCRGKLKVEPRKKWEYEHDGKHTYFWGLDLDEKRRIPNIVNAMADFTHRFPLIEKEMTKEDAHGLAFRLGLKRPAMYDMGYHNNNCIGCVKGHKGYWNKIRQDFPDVFARRAKLEREIGHSCINGVFLDELDPEAGRHEKPIMQECGIYCMLNLELNDDEQERDGK
jgi:hypothetical protein